MEAVEVWFDDLVSERLTNIDIATCRLCGTRRREVQQDEDEILVEHLTKYEYEYDLRLPRASQMEQTATWIALNLRERYRSTPTDDIDWCALARSTRAKVHRNAFRNRSFRVPRPR